MSNKKNERLYIAYGSNLNLEQMARRCPTAEVVGKTQLHNFRLMFRGKGTAVATVEKQEGGHRMKMDFSKDELAMVYQYAAGTKDDTLAGLKEIVPVIRDRQTREIVESTIRKLDAIPEPECRRFIADTKQHFIQKRDNSIRRRLAEARAQTRTQKPQTKRKQPDRERS